jgi:folate-binding protein YgfZ
MRSDIQAAFVDGPGDVVWLSGADRLAFLERLSTNRLTDLSAETGRATAILHDNGRVVDLVYAFAGSAGVALITSGPGASAAVTAHLRGYVMYHDQVNVTDAAGQVAVLRLLGPTAFRVAADLVGPATRDLAPGEWRRAEAPNGEYWALAHPPLAGLGGVDLVATRGPDAEGLRARLIATGAVPLTDEDYAATRIRAGLSAFGQEIDGLGNPLELGLRSVVDFAKGCYIGQEVVARLDAYDKVQRRLVRLTANTSLSPGDAVRLADGASGSRRTATGRVTTAAPASNGAGWIALALVPRRWSAAASVTVGDSGRTAVIIAVAERTDAGPQSGPAP